MIMGGYMALNDELINKKQKEIIASLKYILGDKKDVIIAIVNPLKNYEQLDYFMKYLANNYNDKELMRIDRLLKKSLQISKESKLC